MTGALPQEVAPRKDLSLLAPRFAASVERLLLQMKLNGFDPVVAESLRTNERQAYLYGFGRDYDDGRGIVTNSATADTTWHGYGLAVDIVSKSKLWDAPEMFWKALGETASAHGLAWGGDWPSFPDKPHVQFGPPMRRSPSPLAKEIVSEHGLEGLWRVVGAA